MVRQALGFRKNRSSAWNFQLLRVSPTQGSHVKGLDAALLTIAVMPSVYYLLAIYSIWSRFRGMRKTACASLPDAPPVSILKPVRGMDHEAYQNFASFCQQDYPQYEILFAVADADDPAIPVIEKIQRDFPLVRIRLFIGTEQLGTNPKLNNLVKLAREARHDLLVVSDSDVRVAPDYLRQVAALLQDPGVGAVTTFFRGVVKGGLAARLEALGLATETVPNALVAQVIENKIQFAFGWTIAMTKANLQAIGGFESMVNCHSDDFELGNRIAARGLKVELLPTAVELIFPPKSLSEYWQHEVRWAVGLRNVRPLGYLGLLLTFGLPWTLLAVTLAPASPRIAFYILSYLLLRLAQVWIAGAWALDDAATRRNWWLTPLRDAVSFLVWVTGLFSSTVRWRGISYRVSRGLLLPAAVANGVNNR